jgi:hypothetical protein
LELPKVDNLPGGELKAWVKFLGAKQEKDLEEAGSMVQEVEEAVTMLKHISDDPAVQEAYEQQLKLQWDAKAQAEYIYGPIIAQKDAQIKQKDAQIAELERQLRALAGK